MKDRHPLASDDSDVQSGDLFLVYGRAHRLLATVASAVLLSDVDSHHLFLVQHADGRIGPPDVARVAEMIGDGTLVPLDAKPSDDVGIERMEVEIGILDAACVRNGEKSIWLHLNAVWNDDLRRRYGRFDDPATIRRWRTAQRRAARAAERMERSDA